MRATYLVQAGKKHRGRSLLVAAAAPGVSAAPQEAVHALGEKHSGLGKVLENAGVRETHDIAGLKQAMQVGNERTSAREACADRTGSFQPRFGSVAARC